MLGYQCVIATLHTLHPDPLSRFAFNIESLVAPVEIKGTRGDSQYVHVYVQLCSLLPAEVEQRPRRGGDAIIRPAQQVKLRQGSGLLRLEVLQVEATHQEVLTPDVL